MSTPSLLEQLASQLNLPLQTELLSFETLTSNSQANRSVVSLMHSQGVLTLIGEQRLTFLQGQSCCDSKVLAENQGTFGAFCNLKGRVISNFFAINDDHACHLIMNRTLVPRLKEHLQKYAVFSRVELIDNSDQLSVFGCCATQAPDIAEESPVTFHCQPTPDVLSASSDALNLGWYLVKNDSLNTDIATKVIPQLPKDYHWVTEPVFSQYLMMNKLAWVTEATYELLLPQLIDLERLNGLSFTKGCYTGQEIIARMKYRGQLKRSMQLMHANSEAPLTAGCTFNSDEKKNVGHIINAIRCSGTEQLALVSVETEQLNQQHFSINDQPFSAQFLG